jgi:hypothetical protein
MQLGDLVDPASAEFDARLAAAIAAALSDKDRTRLGVSPEEIAGALHTVAQGAKYLSNARAESREEFVARMTAAVRVVFAGFGTTAKKRHDRQARRYSCAAGRSPPSKAWRLTDGCIRCRRRSSAMTAFSAVTARRGRSCRRLGCCKRDERARMRRSASS